MGVLNVTPDSFSDGGRWFDHGAAVAHGVELAAEGADVVDVGGESTRPGAEPVDAEEERRRVVPVVQRLAEAGLTVSVDTMKASVAAAALDAGAVIVNDVSAGRHDPAMLGVVAGAGAGYVAMHMQGEPRTMQAAPRYHDVVTDVGDFLVARLDAARVAGIADESLMADPGIGFGKTVRHNLDLLTGLPSLVARVGVPVLIGSSRKSFVGAVLDVSADEREEGTLATIAWSLDHGAAMVRVHDARSAVRVAQLLHALARATPEGVAA